MESKKDKYFVDGFLIRHFGIFPFNFDKENLFEEQKIFLIYLMGNIPDMDQWKINVEYNSNLNKIKKLNKISLDQTEIDLAELQGKNLKQVERDKLLAEKTKKIKELNEKFGIKEEEDEIEKVVAEKTEIDNNNPGRLWDLLNLKGLVK